MGDTVRKYVEDKRQPLLILAAMVAALAVLYVGSLIFGGDDGDESDPGQARVVCEQMVRQKLVNPSTADFSYPDEQSSDEIRGSLTGENRLGGKVTMNYVCALSDGTVTSATLVER